MAIDYLSLRERVDNISKMAKAKEDEKVKGPGGHIPDGTGPHGRGMGPGNGKADGSGLKKKEEKEDSKMTELSSEQRNALKDSDFAAIYMVNGKKIRKLPIYDKAHAIAAKQALSGARGGVDLPMAIKSKAIAKVESALKRFGVGEDKSSKQSEQKESKEETKMSEDKKEVSKFSDDKVKAIQEIVGKMKKLSEGKEINKEELVKITQELEAVIKIQEKTEPIDKPKEDAKKEEKPEDKAEEKKDEAKPDEKADDKNEEIIDDTKKEDKKDDAKEEIAKETEEIKEPEKSDKKEESKDEDKKDDTSKQGEIQKAYKEVADEAITKLTEINKLYKAEQSRTEELTKQNISLKEEISKFKDVEHKKLVEEVVGEMSKFRDYSEAQKDKKRHEISKMSDEALDVMKAEFSEMNVSKLAEEDTQTQSSQELETSKKTEEDTVSKMQKDEIRKRISNMLS